MHAATSKSAVQKSGRPSYIPLLPGDIVVTTPRLRLRTPDEVDYLILTDIAEAIKRTAEDETGLPDILKSKDIGRRPDERFLRQIARPRTFFEFGIHAGDSLVGDIAIDCGDERNLDKPDTEIYMGSNAPKGSAEEAYMAICTVGFALNYRAMLREIAPGNGPSIRIADNLGYKWQGPSLHYDGIDRYVIQLKGFAAMLPGLSEKLAGRYADNGIDPGDKNDWLGWNAAKWENAIKKAAKNPHAFYRPKGVHIGPFHYKFTL